MKTVKLYLKQVIASADKPRNTTARGVSNRQMPVNEGQIYYEIAKTVDAGTEFIIGEALTGDFVNRLSDSRRHTVTITK